VPRTSNLAPPVGILGGTFDPIHYAHLRLGEELADRVGLAQVRFVPARVPPHRATPNVTAEHRLEMTRLATAGNPRFTVDDRECRRQGPSYTLDTLHELRAELGAARPFCLLMGVDAYLGLTTWSRWLQLYETAHIVIAHRPGFALDTHAMPGELAQQTASRLTADARTLHGRPGGLVLAVDIPALDISATVIRTLIRGGHSARYLLPDDVLDYIERNRLYKDFDAD
jgi:nicotinate-nucleotide adenylyltransferase